MVDVELRINGADFSFVALELEVSVIVGHSLSHFDVDR